MTKPSPPPGNRGLPLLGETLDFLTGPGPFVTKRFEQHGCPFKSNVVFNQTVFLRGAEAAEIFLNDELVSKVGSVPRPLMVLFSGDGLVNMIDGEAHRVRKQLLLSAFDEEACASYVPTLQELCARFLETWAAQPSARVLDDLKALCIESIGSTIFGIDDPSELREIQTDTEAVLRAMSALPINLPGTQYGGGVKAVKRIIARYTANVEAQRGAERQTGVTRLLAARIGNESLSAETIARELHHAVIAGYIAFANLAAFFVQLDRHSDVRDRIVAELNEAGLTDALDARPLPYLDRVVDETKRVTPNVPIAFWTARKTFEFQGHTIQKGWGLVLCTTETSKSPDHWAQPEEFDPDRFAPGGEFETSPHAFAPQGVGPITGHKCLGFHFSSTLMRVFAALLARDYTWQLPDQDLSLDMSMIPPELRSGLRIELARR